MSPASIVPGDSINSRLLNWLSKISIICSTSPLLDSAPGRVIIAQFGVINATSSTNVESG